MQKALQLVLSPPTMLIAGFLILTPGPAWAQVEEARDAIANGDHLEAIEILGPAIALNPTPDAYLYLGLAHANLTQYERALEVFATAAGRYPADPRFQSEIAGVHLANRDTDAAIAALQTALDIDPDDVYASDLLASIRLSEGGVKEALAIWNTVDRPEIAGIFENFSPGFLNASLPRALNFNTGEVLTYDTWKTTRNRLYRTRIFSNVSLDIEPSGPDDLYNAIVRTSNRTNRRSIFLLRAIRGLPVETAHLDLWNIGFSGISLESSYRWDEDRRKFRARLTLPLPLATLPVLDVVHSWRRERWNLLPSIREAFVPDAAFDYTVNSIGVNLTLTPVHQAAVSFGFDYRNRDASGTIDALATDSRNSATLKFGLILEPVDGRYRNQIRFRGFLARKSLAGDFDFRGGSVVVRNRFLLDDAGRAVLNGSLTAGTGRGELPVDHYFILGLGDLADYPLRAHVASDQGRYGRAPMGTDFLLINTDFQYRLLTIPLFGNFDLPFIQVHAMGFFDSAKTFDRQRIFRQGEWLNDAGAGIRFETPTTAFTVLYGRNTHRGENAFYGYIEQRW